MHEAPQISPEHKLLDRETLAHLPKVVLHDHLDGGLRPSTLIELADSAGVKLPANSEDELARWFVESASSGSLEAYLSTFDLTVSVMQTPEAITRITREALEDLRADHVVYAELRMAPALLTRGDLDLQDAVDAMLAGMDVDGIEARLILCAMRQDDDAMQIAELVVNNRERGVVGFDLAGPENGFPPSRHAAALEFLRQNFLPVTLHAGEDAGVESIAEAVTAGAVRLGHGALITDDFSADIDGITLGRVSSWVRDRRIALELCPSSNLQTGVIDDIADHPFPMLDEMGFTCTVNTDNRLVSGTTMTDEMMILVEQFDYDLDRLFEITVAALEASFLPEPTRTYLIAAHILPAYQELRDRDFDDIEGANADTEKGPVDDEPFGE